MLGFILYLKYIKLKKWNDNNELNLMLNSLSHWKIKLSQYVNLYDPK
jgi:hypothetical protein